MTVLWSHCGHNGSFKRYTHYEIAVTKFQQLRIAIASARTIQSERPLIEEEEKIGPINETGRGGRYKTSRSGGSGKLKWFDKCNFCLEAA